MSGREPPAPSAGEGAELPRVEASAIAPSPEARPLEQAIADYLAKDKGAAWFRQRVAAERAAATGAHAGQGPGILKNWTKI